MTQPGSAPQAPTSAPLLAPPSIRLPTPQSLTVPLVDVEVTDANGAVNETVRSMETVGQTDRIVLEQRPGQPYLILDGKRRVINARKLGWSAMTAEVYPPLTTEQRAHLKLSLHRRAPNKVDEAKALSDLARAHGLSLTSKEAPEELARISGLKLGQVRRYLKFMHLPSDVLELIGTTLSEGVAEGVANLQGKHRDDAILAIRTAAASDDGRFTGQDLKDVQLARAADMGQALHLAGPLPQILSLSPVQALASDVRVMASERNIRLDDLIQELQSGDIPTLEDPFQAAFGTVTPVAAPVTAPTAPLLTATASPWDAAPVGPVLSAAASPWETPALPDMPLSTPEVAPPAPVWTTQDAGEPSGQTAVLTLPETPAPVTAWDAPGETALAPEEPSAAIVGDAAAEALPTEAHPDPVAEDATRVDAAQDVTETVKTDPAVPGAPADLNPLPEGDLADTFAAGLDLNQLFALSEPEADAGDAGQPTADPAPEGPADLTALADRDVVQHADGSTTERVGDLIVTNRPARPFIPGAVSAAPTPGGRARPGRR